MWLILLTTFRFFQIVGGVSVGEVTINDAFPATLAGLTAPAGAALVDVTNHPEFTIGCTYSRGVSNGTRSTAQGVDTCVAPAPVKVVPLAIIAGQLTAIEWTAFQTKIATGSATAALDLAQLLSPGLTSALATAVLNDAAAQSIITPARAATLTTALVAAAQ